MADHTADSDTQQLMRNQEDKVPPKGRNLVKKRLANMRRRAQMHSIEIDYQGTTHHGTYVVEKGILTVRSSLGSRSTQLVTSGTVNAVGLAKQILWELAVQES
jgi:hypothetical protein